MTSFANYPCSRPFASKRPGACAYTGLPFAAGEQIRAVCDGFDAGKNENTNVRFVLDRFTALACDPIATRTMPEMPGTPARLWVWSKTAQAKLFSWNGTAFDGKTLNQFRATVVAHGVVFKLERIEKV